MKKILLLIVFMLPFNLLANDFIVKIKDRIDNKTYTDKVLNNHKIFTPIFKNLYDSKKNNPQSEVIENRLRNFYVVEKSNVEILTQYESIIEFIEPNFIYKIEQTENKPDDEFFDEQWALKTIDAVSAWKYATGKGIKVGVIDTGIDFQHPDLINQLAINPKEDINNSGEFEPWSEEIDINGVTGDLNGKDDDGNGYIDDVLGYDFVDQTIVNIGDSQDIDPNPYDENGHGTSVSGVIAAEHNNGIGITGVAYDSKILTARAFDATGNAESDDIAKSIVYLAKNGVKVMNFSFGEVYRSELVHAAIKYAYVLGVVMVGSSGNNNWDLKHYPSDFEEVISVTATTSENKRGANGNYGNRLDIAAPGAGIYTTKSDSSYGLKSGTSFAAPHISAASALLFEVNENITPTEIAGTLKETALDISDRGWDYQYASGIVDCKKALEQLSHSIITINSPENDSYILRNDQSILVEGSIITPLFKDYEVYWGYGERPSEWVSFLSETTEQVKNDEIFRINTNDFKDSSYTFRIVVNLKNNSTIEKRFYINFISAETSLEIVEINPKQVIYKDEKKVAVYIITNYPCKLTIKYRPLGSINEFNVVSEHQKYTQYHHLLLTELEENETVFEAEAVAEIDTNIITSKNFSFSYRYNSIPENIVNQKAYGFPMSYLLNKTGDFYNSGNQCLAVNDLSSGDWGKIKIYEFENGEFYTRDTDNKKWIPKGIGDSNGDDIPEIFATVFHESALFQASNKNESPFARTLFSDTLSLNLWAQEMFDIDRDGLDELIAYSDTAFLIYDYSDGYKLKAIADPGRHIGTFPGLAVGDFDSDSNYELAFGNRKGNIFIYEYKNEALKIEYIDSSTYSSSEQYIVSGNFTKADSQEFVIGNFGSSSSFNREDVSDPIWSFKLMKYDAELNYHFIDTIYIYGVRGGLSYNNGISSGDLNMDGYDELIISAFPNLYVFEWDEEFNEFKPIWIYPYTYSNTAVIYDFDQNGINEIGFSTFSGTRFFEFSNFDTPNVPSGFDAWSTGNTSGYFKWDLVENAKSYELLKMEETEKGYIGYTYGLTTENFLNIDTLSENTVYEFVVRSFNDELPNQSSNISNFVKIYTHESIFPLNVKIHDNTKLVIEFSGKLNLRNINPNDFIVLKEDYTVFKNTDFINFFGDSSVILSLTNGLPPGKYKIRIKSFRDYYNSPTIEDTLGFEITNDAQDSELYLKKLDVINKREILLQFSNIPNRIDVLNLSNYTLTPFGKIISIEYNSQNDSSVYLNLSDNELPLSNGKTYTISCHNISSSKGEPMTEGAGKSLSFVYFADDVNDVYTYPSPYSLNSGKDFYFANLPVQSEVVIYTHDMREVTTLSEIDGNGGIEWNLYDSKGKKVNPGVYLFKAIEIKQNGDRVESELNKFLIIP